MSAGPRAGVYPGSFNPLTVAHLAIAHAALGAGALERVDFVISRTPLGKDTHASSIERRLDALTRAAAQRAWMGALVTDAQLIADIARGYDAVIMGADKWAQVRDPAWYGDDPAARDAAVAALPHVFVAPRAGFTVEDAEALAVDPELAETSSTRARAGEHHLIAPEVRRRVIVDGNNVIGSRPDGWWRDRAGAQRALVAQVQALARATGDRIAVVLDGRPLRDLPEGAHEGVLVAYATRGGRNAADDHIVAEVARDADPSSLVVVTSDRALEDRVRELGADVAHAGSFIHELESVRR